MCVCESSAGKMSDAWGEIQAIKIKRNSLRERLEQRKKERRDILGTSSGNNITLPSSSTSNVSALKSDDTKSQLNEIFTTIENGWFCMRPFCTRV